MPITEENNIVEKTNRTLTEDQISAVIKMTSIARVLCIAKREPDKFPDEKEVSIFDTYNAFNCKCLSKEAILRWQNLNYPRYKLSEEEFEILIKLYPYVYTYTPPEGVYYGSLI